VNKLFLCNVLSAVCQTYFLSGSVTPWLPSTGDNWCQKWDTFPIKRCHVLCHSGSKNRQWIAVILFVFLVELRYPYPLSSQHRSPQYPRYGTSAHSGKVCIVPVYCIGLLLL